jgi:hypothetical protein
MYSARPDDPAVERQRPAELAVDAEEDLDVLFSRVGVERRHVAPLAQTDEVDDGIADQQLAAFPFPLGQAGNAGQENVGATDVA